MNPGEKALLVNEKTGVAEINFIKEEPCQEKFSL